jgi:four helix bundle protein
MAENIVLQKSYQFALRIVRLYQHLNDTKHEFVMSKKLLNVGTDIAAFIKSAQEAEFRAGFTHDMNTALQKAGVTEFWLQLLHEAGFLEEAEFASLNADCVELKRLLISIVKSSKGPKQ